MILWKISTNTLCSMLNNAVVKCNQRKSSRNWPITCTTSYSRIARVVSGL